MKIAKSYRFILLITAFILSIATAFGMMNFSPVYGEEVPTPAVGAYFTGTTTKATFTDNGLELKGITAKDKLGFKDSLIINDLTLELKLPENLDTVITFSADSYYVNGNPQKKNDKTTYTTSIENKIVLSVNGNKVDCKVNETNAFSLDKAEVFKLDLEIVNNFLTVDGNGAPTTVDSQNYYRLRNVADRTLGRAFEISFATKQGQEVSSDESFTLVAVDQFRGVEGYKQSLKANDIKNTENHAKPRITLNDSFYTKIKTDNGFIYKAYKVAMGDYETLSYKSHSILGANPELTLININNNVDLETNTDKPKKICFDKAGNIEFGVGVDGEIYETIAVEVKPFDFKEEKSEANAPKLIYDEIALASFKNALQEKVTVEKNDGTTSSVHLGTQLELPSFEDLVYDNFASYASLKKTVHYFTNTKHADSTNMKFTLDTVGIYKFFVTFSDGVNSMDEKDFYEEKEDGSVVTNDKYVFEFEIQDNATIKVERAKAQADGYKGIKHVASRFTIDASGCTTTYVLYYNANENAPEDDKNWILVPRVADLKEDEYNEKYGSSDYDYKEAKTVAYDGKLTFVPTRTGAYKIVCTATSDLSSRTSSDYTIIKVIDPETVEAPSTWLQDNVWSVVFLSVGTLCLIGIIVLLCIKPKEEADND